MTSASENRATRNHRSAKLELFATYAAALALASMAVSISVTQSAVGLAFVLFFAARIVAWRDRHAPQELRRVFPALPAPFLVGALYFGWLILSGLVAAFSDPFGTGDALPLALARAVRNEWSDVPLYLFGLLVLRLGGRTPEQRRVLFGGLALCAVLIVVSGAASVFTEYRLARMLKAWLSGSEFIPGPGNRPQHAFGQFAGVSLYRPIGFMNTRLTYAGLLILVLPHLVGGSLLASRRRTRFFFLGLAAAGGTVLLVNGTRSALFGFVAGGLIFLPPLLWRDREHTGALTFLTPRRLVLLAAAFALLCASAIVFASVSSSETARTLRARVMQAAARADRHTDFARIVLWTQAGELALARPVFGTGAGNFETAGERWRADFLRAHPETWYYIKNTPRGHAHNDLLHSAAVGGIPAALCFLALIFFSTTALRRPVALEDTGFRRGDYLLAGSAAFFLAGFAQCYFQDDEVVTLFWAGLALAHLHEVGIRGGPESSGK